MAHLAEKVSEALFGKGEQGEVMDACHRVLSRNEGPPTLTSNFGQPFGDMKHCLNVGGFVATSDVALMEKQQMFNRSKIPERAVHPCGAGAFGYFEVTKDMTKYCKARFLDSVGKRTPVFVRFSTVTPGREFPDSARNPRGFAVKFYTEDGNYDLVGLNFPIFFVRDPVMGPDLIKSQRRNPANFLLDYDALFDFLTQNPESLHCATMFFSDRGTPFGFRHMHGYGCHTFKWVNSQMQAVYVKYHFVCESGVRNMTWEEAKMMSGEDPDFAKRDLWKHFEEGKEATWKVCVQMMPIEDALTCKWDPFDVTKVWPHSTYPLMEFGRLVLNRNPENYHRDVEQAAFSPGSLVRGIEPSPDPLLQFRMFFYRDAQYHRLGVNLHQVPVNCPYRVSGLHPVGQDGAIRCDRNAVGEPIYYPNGVQGAPTDDPRNNWQPVKVSGVLDRQSVFRHQGKMEEEVEQARNLLMNVMTPQDRERLYFNIAEMLKFCREDVKQRTLKAFSMVHPEYASGITKNLATRSSPATI